VSKPSEEEKLVLDEYLAKRAGKKGKFADPVSAEEKVTLHIKDPKDYQGRSFLQPPQDLGINLKSEEPPDKCFLPKKLIHTWEGHSKGISAIRWFPLTAHLLLSCSLDSKIKLWEVYNKRRMVQTYAGHKQAVRDVCFNNDGTKFLSASYDRLWP
jgi:pre-mRNA-processing factor 17